MSKNPLKLKVAYLYPDILQGYCDLANIETFVQRAKWRDIDVQVQEIWANDRIQSQKYDFYYIGGTNIHALDNAIEYLKQNEDDLIVASASSAPILAVYCGYILFGTTYQLQNKTEVEGLNIFNTITQESKKHYFGKVIGTCDFLHDKTIVGYRKQETSTILQDKIAPFLNLKKGIGNNITDKTEGARINNTIGTYITTPILAQNPHLCDFFISNALRIKYKCKIPLDNLCDDIEWYSHNYILEAK